MPRVGKKTPNGKALQSGNNARNTRNMVAATPDGLGFLKAAFAPPDFNIIDVGGVPDSFNGRTLCRKHTLARSLTSPYLRPPTDTSRVTGWVVALLPTPGVAAWIAEYFIDGSGAESHTDLYPILFPDSTQLFPTTGVNSNMANFTAFRYLANAIELVNVDPALTVQGSVNVLKTRVGSTRESDGSVVWTGGQAIPSLRAIPDYSGKWKDGVYTIGLNTEPDFNFYDVIPPTYDEGSGVAKVAPGDGGEFRLQGRTLPDGIATASSFWFNGMGGSEGVFIYVGCPVSYASGATQSTWMLRVWATVEYKVQPGSLLWPACTVSPPEDLLAMASYRAMTGIAPNAVTVAKNNSFWEVLLGLLSAGGSVLSSVLPAPFNLIAGGVGGLGNLLSSTFYGNRTS